MAQTKVVLQGSPDHAAMLALRQVVLRCPDRSPFTPEEIEREREYIHLALVEEGNVLASLMLASIGNGLVQIHQACVTPERQREGLGARLVAFAEEHALAQGYRTAAFYARPEAVPFWQAMGYVEAADWFAEIGVPDQMMAKRLTPPLPQKGEGAGGEGSLP